MPGRSAATRTSISQTNKRYRGLFDFGLLFSDRPAGLALRRGLVVLGSFGRRSFGRGIFSLALVRSLPGLRAASGRSFGFDGRSVDGRVADRRVDGRVSLSGLLNLGHAENKATSFLKRTL